MSDKNNSSANDAIENAQEIIERFGGIRPMATKMGAAVTTVQGWKKRDTIPAARRGQVIEAAKEHDVDVSDLIDGAARIERGGEDVQVSNENTIENIRVVGSVDDVSDKDENDDVIALGPDNKILDDESESVEAPQSVPHVEGVRVAMTQSSDVGDEHVNERENDVAPDLAARLDEAEKSAVAKSTWINVALILITVAAVAALMWPDSKNNQGRIDGLEQNVGGLRSDVDAVKDEQSFLTTLIPSDLDKRIASLQEKALGVKDKAQGIKDSATASVEKVREVSNDVLAEGAGTIDERAAKLQGHLANAYADPRLDGFRQRLEGMNNSLLGQQRLDGAMGQLSAVLGGFGSGAMGEDLVAQDGADLNSDAQINEALDEARNQDANLNAAFNGVPKEDLKAAALLLGMTQFRESLNRNKQPFADDLDVLTKLVAKDNPQLSAALSRLAPKAEEGVLTPGGLGNEFKSIAGDVVVSSLKGEDVSFRDKASARMNELFQVEKDGQLITGTPTQTAVSKAGGLLEGGDIAGAITQMQSLNGPEAAIAQPWIDEAQATLMAQQLTQFMSGISSGNLNPAAVMQGFDPSALGLEGLSAEGLNLQGMNKPGQPVLMQNEETGINILTTKPVAPLNRR